jgi:hypothetical protein
LFNIQNARFFHCSIFKTPGFCTFHVKFGEPPFPARGAS